MEDRPRGRPKKSVSQMTQKMARVTQWIMRSPMQEPDQGTTCWASMLALSWQHRRQ